MNVILVARNRKYLDNIRELLRAEDEVNTVMVVEGGPADVIGVACRQEPDVLILETAGARLDELAQIEQVARLYPHMAFLLLCESQSPEFLIEAMRVGVREALPYPTSHETLLAAIRRVALRRRPQVQRDGKVLAFISCKGGSGATFLATNVAYALAAAEGKKVLLIDLNLQFGDAALFLMDQKPASTLSDVATQIQRVDQAFLAASLVAVHPNLGVLAAPEDLAHAMEVKPEHIDVLLRLARREYDFIILDASRTLDAVNVRALDYADTIFGVLQVTLPFVRNAKRLLDAFRSLDYPGEKTKLLVARYEKGSDIHLDDVEKVLGMKICKAFPNDYRVVAASVNQGVPALKLARGSAIARELMAFAQALSAEPGRRAGGWFARMFQRA